MTGRTLAATDPTQLASRLRELVSIRGLDELVRRYLGDPEQTGFAGELFDTLGENHPNRFTSDDIAAVSMLDVRFGPRAISQLLVHGDRLNRLLANVDANTDLWDARPTVIDDLRALYQELKTPESEATANGIGPTKASKLLARKRPRLAPITDSVVDAVLDSDGWWHLENLAFVLRTHRDLRGRLTELSELATPRISPLRALDIAIWMLGSNSRSARTARIQVGESYPEISVEPLVHESVVERRTRAVASQTGDGEASWRDANA